MTNITTLAQLEAVPIDRIVRVDGVDWTRTAKGLARDSVDLALFYFEGRVLSGTVLDVSTEPPARGEWWAGSTRTYYLYRVSDTFVYYVSLRNGTVQNWNGSSRRRNWTVSPTLHRLTGVPPAFADSPMETAVNAYGEVFNQMKDAQERAEQLARENVQLQEQARTTSRKPDVIRDSLNAIRTNLDAIAQLMEE